MSSLDTGYPSDNDNPGVTTSVSHQNARRVIQTARNLYLELNLIVLHV
jgi:hypothetical protein